jgi:AraC-like DNA-binding protein
VQLMEFQDIGASPRDIKPFDQWTSDLQSICGRFKPNRYEKSDSVIGGASLLFAGGLELAQVANNLDVINREIDDIRRDYGENLFLLIQLEGTCGVEQHGRQSIIAPGDCILVDSSSPSQFHFGGHYSNHLSVHLPRQIILADKVNPIVVSHRLGSEDPMSVMLRALVAKLMKTGSEDKRAPHLRELLFNATRQAFALEGAPNLEIGESTSARLEIVQILIDRHLTEEKLSPQWLADKIGISLRTLQDDFSVLGTTATSLIRTRRLYLAREQLAQKKHSSSTSIAEIAYSSGFNDISYFNRCFKKVFSCSPTELLHN